MEATFRNAVAAAALAVFCSPAGAGMQTVTLSVPGMNCETCPITVKKALSRVQGVAKVKASYEKREAIVTFDDAKASVQTLQEATANAGYPSTPKP